jgi:prepilin-type processing-associated H-X9-DG protein
VASRLPVLCRTKAPAQLTQCRSNCRQLGLAVLLYRNDNFDAYPFSAGRFSSAGDLLKPGFWPMQLLAYMGGYRNAQPLVYRCPSESAFLSNWPFQLHYQANRMLLSDTMDRDTLIRGAQVRNPAIYWLFMDKGPADFITIRPGGLANPVLAAWNYPPGFPQFRRHSGGVSAAAADGHVDWLRMPPYQPGNASPTGFPELGDCANNQNPSSTWYGNTPFIKLYSRYSTTGF